MIVHQVVGGAGPVDAVTNQARAWRARFASWGWGGEDFAEVFSPDMTRGVMHPLKAYAPRPGELTLLHFSGYVPKLEHRLVAPYAVLSHNVTPARYFWELEPGEAVRCALASQQLATLASGAELAAGVSAFNAADLGVDDPVVIPILFDRGRLPAPAVQAPDGPPTILFVGRLAPHKRQDLIVRAFARYRTLHAPDARLVLVGVPISPDFDARLRRLADDLAPGAAQFANAIDAAELHDHFRSAHAFLCLSEHEGFCIPLLEAFHFGVPVVARPIGGIGEVVGDAGMLLGSDDDLAVVAELLHLAVTEPGLRATLRPRAEARLAHFAADRVAEQMRARLEAIAA
ncbi:MAG: glycosyltransferase [Solirubrobacteraceae bacterium]